MKNKENKNSELISRAKNGDTSAFEELAKSHYKQVFNYALRIAGGDNEIASEITQSAFIKAFLAILKFDERANFSVWLWRIVYNTFIDYTRREEKTEPLEAMELESPEETPEKHYETQQVVDKLHKLISTLTPAHRDTLIMFDILGFSYDEVAEIAGVPVGTIRSRLSRAREEIKEKILENAELFKEFQSSNK